MVGTAHCEYTVQSQELKEVPAFQSEQGNPNTTHVAHLTAAAARVRYLLEDSERSAPSPAQVEEVRSLCMDYCIASPFTRFYFKSHQSGNKPLEDHTLMSHHYVSGRALRQHVAGMGCAVVRDASGAAVDGDAEQRIHVALDKEAAHKTSTKEFMRRVVHDVVSYVLKEPDIYDLLLAQSPDGSFAPGALFHSSTGVTPSDFEQRRPQHATPTAWATAIAWHIAENVAAQRHREKLLTLMMSRAHQYLIECQQESLMDTASRSYGK